MAENRILRLGKKAEFVCHGMVRRLEAYAGCNHREGPAVLHPACCRRICRAEAAKSARFATAVWGIPAEGKTEEELAEEGIRALADFIREIGLSSAFGEMGITDKEVLR